MPPSPAALDPGIPPRTLVLIPARDEAATIRSVVAAARKVLPEAAVLVVDDGSSDATAAEAEAAGAEVVRHTYGAGYGAALHTGFRFARRHGLAPAVQLDADGQHEPADLPRLLEPILAGRADVVVGSRFLGPHPAWVPLARRIGIACFGFLASLGLRHRVTDPTSGFKAMGEKALAVLAGDHFPDDYPDADVLVHLARNGCRIEEVAVRMYPRSTGRSMHSGLRAFYYVYKMSLSLALTPLRRRRSG